MGSAGVLVPGKGIRSISPVFGGSFGGASIWKGNSEGMKTQKILILLTTGPTLRSSVEGSTCEDGDLIDTTKDIGFSRSPNYPNYPSVMHAIADGWRLLGPPIRHTDSGKEWDEHEWWLEK